MLRNTLIIAKKEMVDGIRDVRPLVSSLLYCLMGPAVVFLVSLRDDPSAQAGAESSVLTGMMSVFVLVSSFVGGMNVAMDVLAGERERRSLLPLLMNAATRRDVIFGKWIAVACFSTVALALDLAAFAAVLARAHIHVGGKLTDSVLILATGLLPLALFASALELGISTACRTVKEAHTYLSMLVFLPMGLGMFAVFFPRAATGWRHFLPLIGQQWEVEHWISGSAMPLIQMLGLGGVTAALTGLALWMAARLLERDDVVYGG
jgi:sodium transport system permease protein